MCISNAHQHFQAKAEPGQRIPFEHHGNALQTPTTNFWSLRLHRIKNCRIWINVLEKVVNKCVQTRTNMDKYEADCEDLRKASENNSTMQCWLSVQYKRSGYKNKWRIQLPSFILECEFQESRLANPWTPIPTGQALRLPLRAFMHQ